MILYIIRHAWAGHYGDPQWPDDFRRPLSTAGKERFADFAEQFATEEAITAAKIPVQAARHWAHNDELLGATLEEVEAVIGTIAQKFVQGP